MSNVHVQGSFRNFGIIFSLYDVLEFHAHRFFNICSTLSLIKHGLEHGKPTLTKEETGFISDQLHTIRPYCVDVGLKVSVLQLDRVIGALEHDMATLTHVNLAERIHDISVRIQDELQLSLFMQIQDEKARFYLEPWESFGQPVVENFPSLIRDIEEAGKCLAAARNPACVYHLMRIMEMGLKRLGDKLALPITTNRSWDAILKKANAELEKPIKERSAEWRAKETFFSDATARLHAVKNAWRNPSMHVGSDYSDDVALEIYNAVKGFMRHLATELSE